MVDIRFLETPTELELVESLQRLIWPDNETEIVPVHMMRAVVNNGGLIIGGFSGDQLVGFVLGFPGIETTPAGPQPYHTSHMAGVHPEFRDSGLGFRLKRAQWQMARRQGVQRITWTYDPLQSRNANLNIAKLGAVCNTYIPDYYGVLRDGINLGMPSDRFKVDWWVNTNRVRRRLQKRLPRKPDLAHYLEAGIPRVNATQTNAAGLITPQHIAPLADRPALLLLEIPPDILAIKTADPELVLEWSVHIRRLFVDLFNEGYLVTDFVFQPGSQPRSFYVLSYGNATF